MAKSKIVKGGKKQTVRQKLSAGISKPKTRRLKRTSGRLSGLTKSLRREIYLPMPDNKVGRFLNKRRRLTPRYFREAWEELKQVTWPTRRETLKLTLAVFTFAIIFGLLVAVVDFGLDKLFKKVIL